MIVDIHTHAFPDALAPGAMASLEAEAGYPGFYDGTIDGLLRCMDDAGVDTSVIQPVATKPSQVVRANDWASAIASDRIVPFGAMHPDLADAAAEITRMRGLGLRGFKMHPEYQHFAPDEPRIVRLLEATRDAGMCVLFHAGADIAIPTLAGTPDAFSRMLDAVPGLTVILAHMGGFGVWDEVAEHLVGREVYLDTSYTLGHLEDARFVEIVRSHGPDRILFGSDGPWTDSADEIARLRGLPLSEPELEAVLGGNAARLLGLAG